MRFRKLGFSLGKAILAIVPLCALGLVAAEAQELKLGRGAAAVTSFSGTISNVYSGSAAIDLSGSVLRVLNPNAQSGGGNAAREMLSVAAGRLGQVQGIAIDSANPARIFVAASAAYGLFRNDNNSGWAQGMWGPDGGPGTIYVLSEADQFAPKVFATLELEGRQNAAAGIGGLLFDARNNQLFAADLESGMVFRIDAASGEIVDSYDHGVDGRSYFFDTNTKKYEVRDIVSFDPKTRPRFDNCGEGRSAEAARRFAADPACWNIADYRRRVWALTLATDEEGEQRLFYSVWGAAGFGNDAWSADAEGNVNSVWSVGLDRKGGFDLKEVRREISLPRTAAGAAGLPPVGLSSAGARRLFVAEGFWPGIGGTQTLARSYAYRKGTTGGWNSEPAPLVSATGVATGFAYDEAGAVSGDDPAASILAIAAIDCQSAGACKPAAEATRDQTAGLLAAPVSGTGAASLARRIGSTEKAATLAVLGAIAVYTGEAELSDVEIAATPPEPAAEPPASVTPETPDGPETAVAEPAQPEPPLTLPPDDSEPEAEAAEAFDLAVTLEAPATCTPATTCNLSMSLRNAGDTAYSGLVAISGELTGGLSLTEPLPDGWSCSQRGAALTCTAARDALAPGEGAVVNLTLNVPRDGVDPRVRVCGQPLSVGADGREQTRLVQIELARRGFDPGVPDGVMGRRTAEAIRTAQRAQGLPASGQIDQALLGALFGAQALAGMDSDPANDQACARITVDWPQAPRHQLQVSSFHRKLPSSLHDARTSRPADVHDEIMSAFHARYRSSAHDGRTTRPTTRPRHDVQLSRFHRTYSSSMHDGSRSDIAQRHAPSRSFFHDSAPSAIHDARTSRPSGGLHEPSLSFFHQRYRSSAHDGRATRIAPVHDRRLSAFHQGTDSRLHDQRSSRHATGLSSFHGRYESRFHDGFSSALVPFYRGRHDGTFSNFR